MKARTKLFFVAALGLWALCGSVWAVEGSGTEAEPYIITNVDELQAMQNDLDAWYELGNDIDASDTQNWNAGAGFEPVGDSTNYFTGVFDGQGYTITGLYINRPSSTGVGLFGYIDNAEITNVGLIDADVTALGNAGTLVGGSLYSTISQAWASGNLTGTDSSQTSIGGLIGYSKWTGSLVSQCHSGVNVFASSSGSPANRAGGLVGNNNKGSIIIDCYATGNVSGKRKIGGLVSDNTYGSYGGYIKRCYSTGKVTGSGGGLVGYNYKGGVTYDSYWDVQTSGKTSSYGGTGKTTAEMMQQATFVNWDFANTWNIIENETYPFLRWELSGYERAVINIEDAVAEKEEALARIDAALEKEWTAYEALEELLKSGDYGDLSRRDIFKARWKIRFAIRLEKWSKRVLKMSIKKLEEALDALGWEPEPLPEPIAYWKLDEGEEDTAYDSAGDNDGTLINGSTWTTGQVDGALSFDGVDDYVEVSDNPPLEPQNITVAAWVYRDSTSTRDTILQKGSTSYLDGRNGYLFRILGSSDQEANRAMFYIVVGNNNKVSPVSATPIEAHNWYHIAATYDGSNIRIYVNGVEEGTATSETGQIDYTGGQQEFKMGVAELGSGTFQNYFDGTIDDVRFYDLALSADQIQQLYQDGLGGHGKGKK